MSIFDIGWLSKRHQPSLSETRKRNGGVTFILGFHNEAEEEELWKPTRGPWRRTQQRISAWIRNR